MLLMITFASEKAPVNHPVNRRETWYWREYDSVFKPLNFTSPYRPQGLPQSPHVPIFIYVQWEPGMAGAAAGTPPRGSAKLYLPRMIPEHLCCQ